MNTRVSFLASACLLAACAGQIDGTDESTNDPASAGNSSASENDTFIEPRSLAEVTRLARLTHAQYRNTVSDLLGTTDLSADAFAPDALNGFPFDTSINLRVDARLGPQYRSAAEHVAERAVNEPLVFNTIVPCTSRDGACANQFVQSFGERAFRRPLTDSERNRFETLFAGGAELVASGDAFRDGVRVVVEAALQSPQFLYRVELSQEADREANIPLNSWEMASRLSYLLYDSMPDAELFALARSDQLSNLDQVQVAVDRLLGRERVLPKLSSFHEQAWEFSRFSRISASPMVYPLAPSDLSERVLPASLAFLKEVILQSGGLREFLTAPYAYADAALAPLYGMRVGPALQRIEFDPAVRQGLFMQVGFLASHAHSVKTDPIHRGVFVQRALLCAGIPDPPPGASNSPLPSTSKPIETTREEVELLTGQPTCTGCHQQINPPGFAFENFDAVGQLRLSEGGAAIDTSGTMTLDGASVEFNGAVELIAAIAESQDAANCYAEKWLSFAHGRKLLPEDLATRQALGAAPLSVKQIVKALTSSPEFLSRSARKVSQ